MVVVVCECVLINYKVWSGSSFPCFSNKKGGRHKEREKEKTLEPSCPSKHQFGWLKTRWIFSWEKLQIHFFVLWLWVYVQSFTWMQPTYTRSGVEQSEFSHVQDLLSRPYILLSPILLFHLNEWKFTEKLTNNNWVWVMYSLKLFSTCNISPPWLWHWDSYYHAKMYYFHFSFSCHFFPPLSHTQAGWQLFCKRSALCHESWV